MAQPVQILRSTGSAPPSSLAAGEQAYCEASGAMYIGTIGGGIVQTNRSGIIASTPYAGNRTATAADAGAIALMQGGAGATFFTVDPSALAVGSSGIVAQGSTTPAQIVAATGTLQLGGATAKTAKQGAWLTWRVKSSTIVEVHGECAAS